MPRKQTPTPSEAAAAALEQADQAISTARANLAANRQQARELDIEQRDLHERIDAELVAAGRDARPPNHVAEWRQRLVVLLERRHDLDAQERGAVLAVSAAEDQRKRAQLDGYPVFAAELDQAEAELVERRARLEAEQAQLEADEAQQRTNWTALVSVVPGFERGSSFTPLEHQHVHFSHGQAPAPLLHPARRPEDADGALLGYEPAEWWPAWLRQAWERTPRAEPANPVVMAMSGATFSDDDSDDTTPAPTPADEAEQVRRLAAAASDAAASRNSIAM
jgi:hypothetical protein